MATRPYPSFLIYLDSDGHYRWRCEAANGSRIIADSGEGYHNYADCRNMIPVVAGAAANIWQTKEVTDRTRN